MKTPSPKYRINAVAEQTGLAPATLRAWERRYGIPTPNRSDSSYRLYSDDDISLIRRLVAMRDQGMSPADAARVLLERPALERDRTGAPGASADDDVFAALREELVDATRRYDPDGLRDGLARALSVGSATVITRHVLMPVMRTIGSQWQSGEISISQEHMATQIIESSARKLLDLLEPSGPNAPRIVLGCFAEDQHSLPLHAVALELAGSGFRIVSLGPRTPPAAIRHAVDALDAACVGLSITIDLPASSAEEVVEAYATACGSTPWVVGGRGAEPLRTAVESQGGKVFVQGGASITQQVEALLSVRPKARPKAR